MRIPGSSRAAGLMLALCTGVAVSAGACAVVGVAAGSASVGEPESVRADTVPKTVVLLHGLGRTHRSMGSLERALEGAGYRVVNLGYPSRSYTVGALADTVAVELERCCAEAGPIHFVTHSLGGILVRTYGSVYGSDRIGRVVMLSPPNQGSEVVDRMPQGFLRFALGPAAIELGTDTGSVVHDLPPVDFELGIITGEATLNPLFSWWLPGDDDGKVTVESAQVEGADDFLVVPYSHTFIMSHAQVIDEVLAFLAHGSFITR